METMDIVLFFATFIAAFAYAAWNNSKPTIKFHSNCPGPQNYQLRFDGKAIKGSIHIWRQIFR